MAIRRMFSKEIVEADRFLSLPPYAQLLYFHLCMHADDDGFIISPKSVCMTLRARQSDLQLLAEQGLIHRFDDGVVLVMDWLVNNTIRRDRYRMSRELSRKRISYGADRRYCILGPGDPALQEELHRRVEEVTATVRLNVRPLSPGAEPGGYPQDDLAEPC